MAESSILSVFDTFSYLLGQDEGSYTFGSYSDMKHFLDSPPPMTETNPIKRCNLVSLYQKKQIARAAKPTGQVVCEYEIDMLVTIYYPEETSYSQIYSDSDTVSRKFCTYYSLNTTSVITKEIKYDKDLKMWKIDLIISVNVTEDEYNGSN